MDSDNLLNNNQINQSKFKYKEQDPDYEGDSVNQNLINGPLENRKCQDLICVIIFFAYVILMGVVAIFAFSNGNPTLLATPFDPDGRQCGFSNQNGDATGYPYLYYSSPDSEQKMDQYSCIKECPKEDGNPVDCKTNSLVTSCPQSSYKTYQLVKICYPKYDLYSSWVSKFINIGTFEQWASDIQQTWPVLFMVSGICICISFLTLVAMKYLITCIVWGIIAIYFTVITLLGSFLLYVAQTQYYLEYIPTDLQDIGTIRALGISFLVVDAISLLILICCCRMIKITIGILKAAADFVWDVPQILTVPVFMFLKTLIFFSIWITVCIYIYSCGNIKEDLNYFLPFNQIDWMTGVKRSFGVYIFAMYWFTQLLISLGQFVISSTTCMWYFSHSPHYKLHNPVSRSFFRAYIYQFGSLCFGSMVLAIMKVIIAIMEQFHKNLKNQAETDITGSARAAACLVKCATCCVKCFEKFVRYVSEQAFIIMALEGKNFCQSSYDAFYLIFRNKRQFGIQSALGQIFLVFSMLCITSLSALCGFLIITHVDHYSIMIFEPAVPTVLFFLVAYVIAYIIMAVYGMAADALLICLLVDRELSKGKGNYVPYVLQKFLDQYVN